MIKKIFVMIAMLTIGFNFAQDGSVSPYSFYGTGDIRFKGLIENRAMGGISVFTDSIHLNVLNPASLGGLKLTTFAAALSAETLKVKSANESENASRTSFNYLALGFPVTRSGKAGVSFGLIPYSAAKYNVQSLDEDADPISLTRYSGNGGINKVFFSVGFQLTNNLSLGATGNFNFGSVEHKSFQLLNQVQYGTEYMNRSDYSGFDFNFAANYRAKIANKYLLHTSLMYAPKAKITSSNFREISTIFVQSSGLESTVETHEVDLTAENLNSTYIERPAAYTFGLGLGNPRKWFVGGEYEMKELSKYKNEFFYTPDGSYEDANRISVGGFFIPDYGSFTSYWKRVTYRLGVKSEKTGLVVNGESVNDFGMTLGLGLPLPGFSNATVAFEYGKRGSTDFGGIQENYFNVLVSLSLNDRWFRKNLIN